MAAQPTSHDCLIGLGSNLGDSQDLLESAIERLQQHPEIVVTAVSGWLQTKPIGGEPAAPAYLNGAARLTTTLSAKDLLQTLLTIESGLGRERQKRWTSRTVDLDLLLHGQTVCDDPTGATVPHPWMAIRAFVLQPAVEIAGDMVHPQIGWTLETLWRHAQRRPVVVLLHGLGNNFSRMGGIGNQLFASHDPADGHRSPRFSGPVGCATHTRLELPNTSVGSQRWLEPDPVSRRSEYFRRSSLCTQHHDFFGRHRRGHSSDAIRNWSAIAPCNHGPELVATSGACRDRWHIRLTTNDIIRCSERVRPADKYCDSAIWRLSCPQFLVIWFFKLGSLFFA